MKNEQKGFTVVELLVVIAVLVVVGFVGYFIGTHHGSTKTSTLTSASTQSPTSSSSSPPSQSTPTHTQTQTSSNQYLTVSQLGIRLPLSSGIQDLVYSLQPGSSSDTLYFSTKSLDAASPSCTPSATSTGAFGAVTVSSTPLSSAQYGSLYANANGYYIYWLHAQAPCVQPAANGTPNQSALTMLNAQLPLFQAALKATTKA